MHEPVSDVTECVTRLGEEHNRRMCHKMNCSTRSQELANKRGGDGRAEQHKALIDRNTKDPRWEKRRSEAWVYYYPGQKNWDNRAHVAQARDLSSMHAPMFGLHACLNFFGQGSTCWSAAHHAALTWPNRGAARLRSSGLPVLSRVAWKENFQLFHFVQPLKKWFVSSVLVNKVFDSPRCSIRCMLTITIIIISIF